jgi:hypothetical protein
LEFIECYQEHIIVCVGPVGHCEESRLGGATKPCPEQSEGTLEIAKGDALATTSSDYHACVPKLLLAGGFMGALRRAGAPFVSESKPSREEITNQIIPDGKEHQEYDED